MASLLYAHPSDNLTSSAATITASTEASGYGVANLYDGNPAKPWKATTTTGTVSFDFGAAVNIDLVALIHHNLTAGLEVRIQADNASDFSSLDLNQTITIPAYEADDFPVNPWIDLSALSNSWRYWRLNVVGTNSANVAIGELWMVGTKRTLTAGHLLYGLQESFEKPIIEHVTDYKVSTIYNLGAKVWSMSGEILTTNAGLTSLRTWWDDCHGRALGTLIIPDDTVNVARLARWADFRRADQRSFYDGNRVRVAWSEISRGLVL